MFPSQSRRIIWLLLSICLMLFLSACGQKGDLYHPDEEQQSSLFINTAA